LPSIIGSARGRAACIVADRITAEQALARSLAHTAVEPERLVDAANSLAVRAAEASPVAVGRLKHLLASADAVSLQDLFELEASEQALLRLAPDYQEAIAAFKEKRPPQFAAGR
jgi:2-(1,2-epoxy-1,2-dihydrophenyl)acetyl-CoA isomerase